ncbi:tetratricopeptide repeat protein [Thermopolyspora sp. NPDC052614]|uniref:ATP-binding protein n=1 Tax=Thermopolyspora sp. NPDC052614 TaxID=3155682 RepID=UPI00341CFC81
MSLEDGVWSHETVLASLQAIVNRVGDMAAGGEHLWFREHFLAMIGDGVPRNRAEDAFAHFLRCIADEVWSLPEFRDVYLGHLQRITAESAAAMVAELRELRHDVVRKARASLPAAERGSRPPSDHVVAAIGGGAASSSATPGPAANSLPRDVAIVGRRQEVSEILAQGRGPGRQDILVINAVNGMAGIGKTALAVHVAHRIKADYPDGCLFIDLHGYTAGQPPLEPGEALGTLLRLAEVPDQAIPQDVDGRVALWRSVMSTRRALIVLDNASGHEQVHPLLPGSATCRVLITSRKQLTGLGHARSLSLPCLSMDDAVALLADIIGGDRARREPDAMRWVADLCGRLPLAIQLAGNRLRHRPGWTVASFARKLSTARSRSALLRNEDIALDAAFELSYRGLTARQRSMFAMLGLHEGPSFSADAAAALLDVDRDLAEEVLELLHDHNLLEQPSPERHQFHDLLKDFARSIAAESDPAACRAATSRLISYYLGGTCAADAHIGERLSRIPDGVVPPSAMTFESRESALKWLETERLNIFAAARQAEEVIPPAVCQIATAIAGFLILRGYIKEAADLHMRALRIAHDAGDPATRAVVGEHLGEAKWHLGSFAEALEDFEGALRLYRSIEDASGEARALDWIGFTYERTGEYAKSLQVLQDALDIRHELGDLAGQAKTLHSLGAVYWRKADYKEALRCFGPALRIRTDLMDLHGQARTMNNIGFTFERMNVLDEAEAYLTHALQLAIRVGDRQLENIVYNNFGYLYVRMGRHESAEKHSTRGRILARQTGSVYEEARALDGLGRAHLGRGRTGGGPGDPRPGPQTISAPRGARGAGGTSDTFRYRHGIDRPTSFDHR